MNVSATLLIGGTGFTNKILHVIADQDISITAYQGRNTGFQDGYTVLPVTAYGLEYVTAHYATSTFWETVAVVAYEDNSSISIRIPHSVSILGQTVSANTPYNITLHKSQVFSFIALKDLTGTLVSSNKPIAVFGNQKFIQVPLGTGWADYMAVQYPAIDYLGNVYVTTIFPGRAFDRYRVIGAYDATNMSIGHLNPVINKGRFYEFSAGGRYVGLLRCNKPCLVAHYSQGASIDKSTSDPSMSIIQSIDQYMSEYQIYVHNASAMFVKESYITLTILDNDKDGLRLDGQPLPNVTWYKITTPFAEYAHYVAASVLISGGRHTVNHTSETAKFGLLQYGHAHFRAEGAYSFYPGYRFNATYQCK